MVLVHYPCPAVLRIPLSASGISSTGLAPSATELSISFDYPICCYVAVLQPQHLAGLGSSRFARHYSGNHSYFLFLQVLRCFNSLGCLLTSYLIRIWITEIFISAGFPHSDTCASLTVYVSTQRFAVFCVLLLLYMPRHPPYALLHLITLLENC